MKRHAVALAISVILNMLLGGMLLGDISGRLVTHASTDSQALLAKLPADKQALFNDILVPAKKRMDGERAQIDAAKKEALRILSAEPFDSLAYLTQVQHINDMHVQMKRHMAEAVVELARQLTSEQRAVIKEVLSHPPFTMPPPAK